ncbi:MAG: hypothetical protein Q4C69_00530 [Lachnoclostridium edouardi]|uniref:hypothetical protein n=1 Tax=Lachnoclostridium edouardi TaxID=1926283 RepID=UPI0026DC5EA4|nr:hypothetical protein [Lachnoclostridium edouardi]MDO4277285.1 hypothetical protein [Lachnoclostridium edouardi]
MCRRILVLLLAGTLLLTGCAGEKVPEWELGDVFFFDYKGEAKVAPGDEKTFIYLKDYPSLQTYRGVRVGDDAKEALKKYNLDEFKFEFFATKATSEEFEELSRKCGEMAKEYTEKYEDVSAKEMINRLEEIAEFADVNGKFYFFVQLRYYDNKMEYLSPERKEIGLRKLGGYGFTILIYVNPKTEKITDVRISDVL